MITITKKLLLLFFIFILTDFHSCRGQINVQQKKGNAISGQVRINGGEPVSELSNSIWYIFQASNGDYWFGSDTDGLYRFDTRLHEKGGKEKSLFRYSTQNGLSSNRIRGIQEDKLGNLYFTTLNGIHKFDGNFFSTLEVARGDTTHKWKLQENDLWFSTLGKNGEKGPYRFDGKYLYPLRFPKHPLEDSYFAQYPNYAWSPYDVYSIYKDKSGTLWFGTSNFGICRFDAHLNDTVYGENSLKWLYEDHLTYTPKGGSFGIRSMIQDSDGKYWFCNTRYRYHILPDEGTDSASHLISYQREIGIEGIQTKEGRKEIYFMSVIEDANRSLWMATYNEGVWRYDAPSANGMPARIKHYPVLDGEKEVTLFSIYYDKKGEIWLGTHTSGVYKYNGKSFEKFRI